MKFFPNFSRPDVIFATIWGFVLLLYIPVPTIITPPLGGDVMTMLLVNICSGPIIYTLVRVSVERNAGKRRPVERPAVSDVDRQLMVRFLKIVMAVWIAIFVINVLASGGFPLLWYLTGDGRQYLDFGVLSLSGFGEMFRFFSTTLCIVLFMVTRRRIYLLLWFAQFLPSILMVSRASVAVFLSQSICAFLLLQRITPRQMLITAGTISLMVIAFLALGSLRGLQMSAADYVGVDKYLGGLPVGFYWIWTYFVTPLGNVSYAASLGLHPSYIPQFSLVYLVPGALRNLFFSSATSYTPMTSEQFNATSIYAPLIQDFGLTGATIAISVLLLISSYVHVKARRGNIFYIMMYPALFSSLALSFFHIFALTPPVIAVPFLCIWFRRYVLRGRAEIALRSSGRAAVGIAATASPGL